MSSRLFLMGAVVIAAAVAFFGGRTRIETLPAAHTAALRDRSLSDREGCKSFVGIVDQLLNRTIERRGSTMVLAVTGDDETANEPIEVTAGELPVNSHRSIEGPHAITKSRAAFLTRVAAACEAAGLTKRSPIHLAIHRIVSQVNQLGDASSTRVVWIQTDLEELAEPTIKLALRDPKSHDYQKLSKIDNSGVSIQFCGEAETRGNVVGADGHVILTPPRRSSAIERAHEVWSAVFTTPDNVKFSPFCHKWEEPIAQTVD